MSTGSKDRLWAFQPTKTNKSLISKAITRERQRAKKAKEEFTERGWKSRLINEAIRLTYGDLAGKREVTIQS